MLGNAQLAKKRQQRGKFSQISGILAAFCAIRNSLLSFLRIFLFYFYFSKIIVSLLAAK